MSRGTFTADKQLRRWAISARAFYFFQREARFRIRDRTPLTNPMSWNGVGPGGQWGKEKATDRDARDYLWGIWKCDLAFREKRSWNCT